MEKRAILEEEFGKRLAALARTPIGVDETGYVISDEREIEFLSLV